MPALDFCFWSNQGPEDLEELVIKQGAELLISAGLAGAHAGAKGHDCALLFFMLDTTPNLSRRIGPRSRRQDEDLAAGRQRPAEVYGNGRGTGRGARNHQAAGQGE